MEISEGMVAIVQGSRHAGLTVTVLPERTRAFKRKYFNLDVGFKTTTRVSKSNVETNTEKILKNSSIPICDVRYPSSYQFANCLRSPFQANQILGHGSGEMEQSSDTRSCGHSFMYNSRSSYHRSCHMDHFAQSLRSYPSATNSAQLIQKILDYTQARHDKRRHSSRSKRSLLKKSMSQHTNRMKKRGDEAKSTNKIVKNEKPTITKRCSSQEELLHYTYDYLKSSSLVPRRTEVRYLTELKKALRDRLQEIIDNKPMTCPRIHSRYLLHKRKYHENTLNNVPILPRNNMETQARFRRLSRDVSTLTGRTSSNNTQLQPRHKICFCEQPVSCICEKKTSLDKVDDKEKKSFDVKEMQMIQKEINEWINNIPVYPNFNQEDKRKQGEIINNLAFMLKKLKNEDHFNFKAKTEILKCLDALPIWHPSDLNDDTLFKEQKADNLIEKLIQMAESNFLEEIYKEIKELPFDSVSIDSNDFERVVEKFSRNLKPLAVKHSLHDKNYKEALKTEIIKLFNEFPFKNSNRKATKINEIAEKLANQLCKIKLPTNKENAMMLDDLEEDTQKKIVDWYKDISEFSKFDITKDKNLIDELGKKINEHIQRDLQGDDEQVDLKEIIENWLDKVAVKTNRHLDLNTKKQLSNKLIQEFLTSDNNAVNGRAIHENDLTEKDFSHIMGWFEDIPELPGGNKSENKKAVQKLSRKLEEIQSRGNNCETVQINMKEVIHDWLQNMLRTHNKSMDTMTQENLVNQLVLKLNHLKQEKYQQNNHLYKDVITWLKENSGIKSSSYVDPNIINELVSTLTDIEKNSDEKNIEAQTKDAITIFINKLSDITGANLPFKEQELLEQNVFKLMKIAPQQRKRLTREIKPSHETEQSQLGKELFTSTPKAYAFNRFSSSFSDASPIHKLSLIDQTLNENEEYMQYVHDIQNAIDSWIKHFDLNITPTERSNLVKNIATDVVERQKYLQLSNNKTSKDNEVEHLKYEIFRRIKKLNNEVLSELISKVNDLNEQVLEIEVPDLIGQTHKRKRSEDIDSPKDFQPLVDSLKAWFNNIPSDIQNLYNTTISDDFILEFVKKLSNHKDNNNRDIDIKNEISQWLSKSFPKLDRHLLNNWTESLKNHLVGHVANAKQREVGSLYRKMLSDTISRTLPSIPNASADDLFDLELLKEKMADAFINLHYFAEDRNTLGKFKAKLIREVDNFCDQYLKRYPEAPLNTEELNRNLYNALKMVSVPNIESIRSELEQVRLKEDIIDWLRKIPLQNPKDIKIQENQMISELAKCLHDIEKDKINLEPSINKDNKMQVEITKWLKNLPIKEDKILNLPDFANELIENLKATSKSRTLSISKIGKYDDNVTISQTGSPVAHYPRSTLSVEDRNHLNRIRRRLNYSGEEPFIPISKDAPISPLSKDIGIQTETSKIEETIQTSRTSLIEKSSLINREISPQVIIKEYYWDSNESNQSLQLNISTSPRRISAPSTQLSKTDQKTQTTAIKTTKEDDAQTIDITQTLDNITQPMESYSRISPPTKKGVGIQTDEISNRQRTNSTRSLCESGMIPYVVRPPNLLKDAPTLHYPDDQVVIRQRISSRPDSVGAGRSGGEICCTCGERMLTKCRGRPHSGCRQHCNVNRLRYCPNYCSRCPYPSYLFFRKEF